MRELFKWGKAFIKILYGIFCREDEFEEKVKKFLSVERKGEKKKEGWAIKRV